MKLEKVFDFGKSYLQINLDQCLGLGINFNRKGIELVVLCFYIGYWFKN